ncbi:tyrosine-protein kinase-like otk isoform X2 [Dicentrarchus labrax]|nr:tyrosine-protein kinase-like otk isoform X2 [Dicentrarchus labrax]XP_051261433.1 tyrosine-protein kinase-like otk isoform X2 [Dicentrarchus labrax]
MFLIWATLFFAVKSNTANTDLTQKPTVTILTEGQQTTLNCTAPGLCSGSRPNITWMWRRTGENDSHITGNITEFKTENLTAVTQRHSSTLTFNLSAEHHGTKVTCKVSFTNNITTEETVTLNVTYVKKPQITGNRTVTEGDTLHLTCKTFPLSLVMWTQVPSNKTLIGLQNKTETATLVIHNVTAEHTGQYVCTAIHFNMTVYANVTVTLHPKILNSSRCKHKLEVLTCVCISHGFPLPTIKWPLLENHPEYFVSTSVSNHTVNSTVILNVKKQSNTVECVSRNKNGKVKGNLSVDEDKQEEEGHVGQIMKLLGVVTRLEMIITFFIGALISAVICCLVTKCHRKKQRTYGNMTETLEMVTSHEEPLIDAGQAVEDEQAIDQEASDAGGAVAAGKSDVEYSNLDFSLINRPNPAEAGTKQGTPETEYAEIKKDKAKEREDGEKREEEEMIGEDEETKYCVPEEEEGEDGALYSTVKDVMGEDSIA